VRVKNNMKRLFSIILLMLLSASAFCYTVSEKLALEKDYADRLERVLVNVVGKGKVFVFVSLELDSLQNQEQKESYVSTGQPEQPAESGRQWLFDENGNRDQQYYLPGYPAGQAKPSQFPTNVQKIVEQTMDVPGTVIKRADVTIMIDPGVAEEIVKPVGRIAGGLLGLSKSRGDTISIKRIPFPPMQTLAEQFKKPELMVEIGKYLLLFVMLMVFIAVFLFLSKDFIRNVAVIGQALRPKLDIAVNQQGGGVEAAPAAAGAGSPARVAGAVLAGAQRVEPRRSSVVIGRAARRFDFINEDNIKRLGVIMKNEPFENISIAVSYLKPKDVSFVLANLEPAKRSAVANRLVNPGETTFEEVEKVEKIIKNKKSIAHKILSSQPL